MAKSKKRNPAPSEETPDTNNVPFNPDSISIPDGFDEVDAGGIVTFSVPGETVRGNITAWYARRTKRSADIVEFVEPNGKRNRFFGSKAIYDFLTDHGIMNETSPDQYEVVESVAKKREVFIAFLGYVEMKGARRFKKYKFGISKEGNKK